MVLSGSPHVLRAHVGRTRGEPNGMGLTTTHGYFTVPLQAMNVTAAAVRAVHALVVYPGDEEALDLGLAHVGGLDAVPLAPLVKPPPTEDDEGEPACHRAAPCTANTGVVPCRSRR